LAMQQCFFTVRFAVVGNVALVVLLPAKQG